MVQSGTLDRTFGALADPTRRAIVERLAGGPATVTQLAVPLRISLPGVLKHVRILEAARLVTTRKRGRVRECRLDPHRMGDATDWIEHQRTLWDVRLDRLDTHLRHHPREGATP